MKVEKVSERKYMPVYDDFFDTIELLKGIRRELIDEGYSEDQFRFVYGSLELSLSDGYVLYGVRDGWIWETSYKLVGEKR